MNCKNCDNNLPNNAKFCNKCGKQVNIEETKINIEKSKKSLRNTGNSVYAIGWLTVAVNVGIYIWSLLDKKFSESGLPQSDLPGMFLMVVAGIIFIILGKRIKDLVDKKIKTYIWILIVISVLLFIWVVLSGGKVGILFFILLAYLISSVVTITKLMKVDEFTTTLTDPKYKLNKNGWIIFCVATIVLFFVFSGLDSVVRNTFSGEPTQLISDSSVSRSDLIRQTVQEIKSEIVLPSKLDEVTTLVDITAQPTAIRYHYELSNIDQSKISNDFLKSYLITNICSNKDTKNLLNQDINMEYSYVDMDTQLTYFIYLSKGDCNPN